VCPSRAPIHGEYRATVADRRVSEVTLAECFTAVMISLLEDRAAMTAEEQATRELRGLFTAWTRRANPEAAGSTRYTVGSSVMLHVCRRNVRNGLDQDGTRRDAAGYRLQIIPGSYEVRAQFC
jgi:hypothetical protein